MLRTKKHYHRVWQSILLALLLVALAYGVLPVWAALQKVTPEGEAQFRRTHTGVRGNETIRRILAGNVIYVNDDAPGPAHDGLSWTTAFTNVQDALATGVWTAHGARQWVPLEAVPLWQVWLPVVVRD